MKPPLRPRLRIRVSVRPVLTVLAVLILGAATAWSASPRAARPTRLQPRTDDRIRAAKLETTAFAAGQGDVRAIQANGAPADQGDLDTTAFAVNAAMVPVTGEIEPNDETDRAQPIGADSVVVRGSLTTASDADLYAFQAIAGDVVYAATRASSLDTVLTLLGPDGTTAIETDDNDGSQDANASSIAGARITQSGTYYLSVTAPKDAAPNKTYDVCLRVRSGAPALETEPNDTTASAGALPSVPWVAGRISTPSDVDLYAVDLEANESVMVQVDLDPSRTGLGWQGVVGMGPFGGAYAVADSKSSDGDPSQAFFMTAHQAGRYYVFVGSRPGSGEYGNYVLNLEKAAPTGLAICSPVTITPNTAIPDNNATFTCFNIVVPSSGVVSGVTLQTGITHSWVGELIMRLVAPDGTTLTVFNRPDFPATGNGDSSNLASTSPLTFFDGAPNDPETMGSTINNNGVICQDDALCNYFANPNGDAGSTISNFAGFNGHQSAGTWKVCISDNANANTGTFVNATLTLTCLPPCVLTCPSNVTVAAAAGQCGANATYSAPGQSGGCFNVVCTPASGSFFPVGTTTVTCSATDGATCNFTVTVNDTQNPSITCPANIVTSNTSGQCSAVVTFAPTVTDNCPGVTSSCVPASGSTFPVGVTSVTCTATDASANTAQCTFSVTVNDTQPPNITCPAPITVTENPPQSGGAVVTFTSTATDNCPPPITPVCVPASGSTFPIGVTTVTCTATDAANNQSQCSFAVTVNPACAITCPANVTVSNAAGQCSAVVNYAAPSTVGACGTITCTPASGSTFPVGTTTVTCSTTAGPSCSFTVTVNDTQPPSITCPANITVGNTPGQCAATVNYTTPTAGDNCPGAGVVCVPASGSSFPRGTTTVTCTATDGAGNTAGCSFTVTVNDTQPPTVTCPANISVNAAGAACSAAVSYTTPTANDNCPGATVSCVPASGSTFAVGTTTVTCTATDGSGNTGSCTFTVTVNDVNPPTITCPANITVGNTAGQCAATVTFSATASDTCSTATTVCVPASGSSFPVGVTSVTCTATDGSGNTAQCSFSVTVNDTQNPTIACPANITTSTAAGQCSAVVNFTTPTGSDNCPGVSVVCVPATGSTFPRGTTTVTCTATDAAAHTAQCSFTVTVNDTQPPTVACPANINVNTVGSACSATVNFTTPTASDNCPGATVACVPASGSSFAVGTTTVTCTATDASNNTGTCSFTVTVRDAGPPSITCPANITTGTTPGQCSAVVTYAPTASDTCSSVTVVCTPASGSTFPRGTTSVTCTATDVSGNTASCGFSVTVNDVQPPTVNCPGNITAVENPPGSGSAVVTYSAGAADPCGLANFGCVPPSGSSFPIGTTTVTCTAVDTSGNTGSCSFSVTVNQACMISITCPANITTGGTVATGCSIGAVVNYPAPTVTSTCNYTVTCVPASGSTFPEGTTTVTCTATDIANNTATCTFTVTVTTGFGACAYDDFNGDTFQIVVDRANPLYGFWRYHVGATNETFCGTASSLSYYPGRSLVAGDTDDIRVWMNANLNYGSNAGTVKMVDQLTGRQFVLRDRNLSNDPPCQ